MKTLYPAIGVLPAINTPFTEDDKIDFDGLQKHLDNAVNAGVAGLLIPVVASEVLRLTAQERHDISVCAQEVVNGRVPIFGAATAPTLEECLAFVRELTAVGAGVMVKIPYECPEQYRSYVKAIAAQDPACLMIQDYDLLGPGVPVELLAELYDEIDCYNCLKVETKLPGGKFTKILTATEGRLHVSGGWCITQYIEALDRGVHGMVPTGMNEIFCKLDKLYRSGHRDKANRLFTSVQPVIAFANQQDILSLHFYKRLLWKQGFYKTPNIRTPGLDFDKYYVRIADEQIERALSLIEDVKAGKYD